MGNWAQYLFAIFVLIMLFIFMGGGPPKTQPEYVCAAI